ncbi:MAG: M20/M25/M40 family metallo-hydrolase [Candidatus Thorarchaeota archaeon]
MISVRVVSSLLIVFLFVPLCSAGGYQSTISNTVASSGVPRIYGVDISETIYSSVSQYAYKNFIVKLTENGSRWSAMDVQHSSDANRYAREWIASELQSLSNNRIEVEITSAHKSVVGRLPGYLPDGPVLMIGGHYDSVPGAPGANDDATGVAAALELARVMSRYNWPLDIYFCAWNSEEIGLYGSHEAALEFKLRGIDILTYYNVDMLLVDDPTAPADERVLMAHTFDSQRYAELTCAMGNNYGHNVIRPMTDSLFGSGWSHSDHYSFYREGYENVMFAFESGFHLDDAYHTEDDVWDNPVYNYTVAYLAVAAIGASMAHTLARAHNQPVSNDFQDILNPSETREFMFSVGKDTRFNAYLEWYGGTIEAELFSPSGLSLGSFISATGSSASILVLNTSIPLGGLCKLVLRSDSVVDLPYTIEVKYDTDFDRDNIPDSEQFWLDDSAFVNDSDGDTISDALEIIYGTDPSSADTDSDSMPDNWEYENLLDPTIDDSQDDNDADGLTNAREYEFGTNPQNEDTDADSLPDGWEADYGTNPLVPDASLDPDADGLTNLQEFGNMTSPVSSDTDNDQIPDLWEIQNDLDPTLDDSFRDDDFDGLDSYEEYIHGTDPHLSDSDWDHMPDGWEVENGLNPLVDDASEDPDNDGKTNLQEYYQRSDPNIPYSEFIPLVIVSCISIVIVIAIGVIFWKRKAVV